MRIFCALLLCSITFTALGKTKLPTLQQHQFTLFPAQKQKIIGSYLFQRIRNSLDVDEKSIETRVYLDNLVAQLAVYSDLENPRLYVHLINDNQINAFALFGGGIGVNSGLLLHSQSEDELASVLAHEIAHLSQQHTNELIYSQQQKQTMYNAALLASIGFLLTGNMSAGIGGVAATSAAQAQTALTITRQNEIEADAIAVRILSQSGRNPAAFMTFLERMLLNSGDVLAPAFLLTHPLTVERIGNVRNLLLQYAVTKSQPMQAFYFTKARVEMAVIQPRSQLAWVLGKKPALQDADDMQQPESVAWQYIYARVLMATGAHQQAEKALAPLSKRWPFAQTVQLLRAQLFIEQQEFTSAEQLLQQQLRFNPQSYPLRIRLAQLLRTTKQYQRIEKTLMPVLRTRPNDVLVWELLQQGWQKTQQIDKAYWSEAELLISYGEYKRALTMLKQAKVESKSSILKAQLQYRREQIQEAIKILETM